MAISVELGGVLDKVLEDLILAGRYNSKSEVLREGVRLVQEREALIVSLEAANAGAMSEAEAERRIALKAVLDQLNG